MKQGNAFGGKLRHFVSAFTAGLALTFTNKTLTAPTIIGGTVTGATINNAASAAKVGTLEVIGSPGRELLADQGGATAPTIKTP